MRVIAGDLSGRVFDSPPGRRTHPMSDRVRGALFNTLGDVSGLTVLDAFAGSGALGFEAVSRGAAHATMIEPDKTAQQAIASNIDRLSAQDKAKLIRAKAQSWLSTAGQMFDIILCDPPYDNVNHRLLSDLGGCAKPGGTVVISLPPGVGAGLSGNFKLLRTKEYGDATLHFYRSLG